MFLTNSSVTFRTFLGVGSDPVARFTVVVTFLLPLFQPFTLDRLVPFLTALKTKGRFARRASDHRYITIRSFDRIRTVRSRTPAHVSVTFDK